MIIILALAVAALEFAHGFTSSVWNLNKNVVFQNLIGSNIRLGKVRSRLECASQCAQIQDCLHFSFVNSSSECFGFNSVSNTNGQAVNGDGVFSKDQVVVACDPGYYFYPVIGNGWCVRYYLSPSLDWNSAKDYCQQEGTRLAVLNSMAKVIAVKATITANLTEADEWWWVGASLRGANWVWTNNQTYDAVSMGFSISENQQDAYCLTYYHPNAIGLDDGECESQGQFMCDKDL